jgi:hypothetical protein
VSGNLGRVASVDELEGATQKTLARTGNDSYWDLLLYKLYVTTCGINR